MLKHPPRPDASWGAPCDDRLSGREEELWGDSCSRFTTGELPAVQNITEWKNKAHTETMIRWTDWWHNYFTFCDDEKLNFRRKNNLVCVLIPTASFTYKLSFPSMTPPLVLEVSLNGPCHELGCVTVQGSPKKQHLKITVNTFITGFKLVRVWYLIYCFYILTTVFTCAAKTNLRSMINEDGQSA